MQGINILNFVVSSESEEDYIQPHPFTRQVYYINRFIDYKDVHELSKQILARGKFHIATHKAK